MSVSTRTAGFNTVNLATEAPPVQVMQLVMMYLSALPVALSIRSSADEAWAPDADLDAAPDAAPAAPSRPKRFRSLLRRALQRDLFLLVAAYWLLSAIERDRIEPADGEAPLSLFRLLYELVSAYGTVGLSLSTTPASLSASLHPASRLVLTGVMLAGRHRGLGLLLPRMLPLRACRGHCLCALCRLIVHCCCANRAAQWSSIRRCRAQARPSHTLRWFDAKPLARSLGERAEEEHGDRHAHAAARLQRLARHGQRRPGGDPGSHGADRVGRWEAVP